MPSDVYFKIKRETRRIAIHSGNLIVGDTVMLNPLVRSVRDSFPESKVDYVGFFQPYMENFARRVLPVDDFVKLELKGNMLSVAASMPSLIGILRKWNYDLIIDNQFVFINSLILRMSKKRWMISQSSNGIFSDFPIQPKRKRPNHVIDRSLAPIRDLGFEIVYGTPKIEVEKKELNEYRNKLEIKGLKSNRRIAGIAPYSAREIKNWDISNFRNIAKKFQDREFDVVIICSEKQIDQTKRDFESMRDSIFISSEILPETRELANIIPLIANMDICVGNDSGTMHISGALDIPALVIFGPTSPIKFAPRGKKVECLMSNVDCSPCDIYKPCGNEHLCMKQLSSEILWKYVEEILK